MRRVRRAAQTIPFVLFMVVVAAVLLWVLNQLATGADQREQQHAEIVALQAGLDEANARLEAGGEQPVPVPSVDSEGTVSVVPIPPTPEQTSAAVGAWFATHDLSLTSGYSEAMQDAVARHLTRNPPPAGKDGEDATGPTDQQIADAVAAYLIANPPADGVNGSNGADGRGVVSAVLDGCDVVFTYTDGSNDRIGPICGKDGTDGKDSTVPGPEGDRGPPGTARPGTYTCPDGEHVAGFTVAEDGAVELSCQAPEPPIIGPPVPSPTPTP